MPAGIRAGREASRQELVGRLGDELSYLGIGADRLDKQELVGIQVHTIGLVELLAALHKHVVYLLGIGIRLAHDVVHVGKHALLQLPLLSFHVLVVEGEHCAEAVRAATDSRVKAKTAAAAVDRSKSR
jgi:hypothetical protein